MELSHNGTKFSDVELREEVDTMMLAVRILYTEKKNCVWLKKLATWGLSSKCFTEMK